MGINKIKIKNKWKKIRILQLLYIFDQMDNNEDHILSNENITSYQRPET
jgi:hypothetical protein